MSIGSIYSTTIYMLLFYQEPTCALLFLHGRGIIVPTRLKYKLHIATTILLVVRSEHQGFYDFLMALRGRVGGRTTRSNVLLHTQTQCSAIHLSLLRLKVEVNGSAPNGNDPSCSIWSV